MPPKWERVADAIRQQIREDRGLERKDDGLYLPSYPNLIEQHAASYSTIRFAVMTLKLEGWIEGEPGIGLRVREDHPA